MRNEIDTKFFREIFSENKINSNSLYGLDRKTLIPNIFCLNFQTTNKPVVFLLPDHSLLEKFFSSIKGWKKLLKINKEIKLVPETNYSGNYLPENEAERTKRRWDALSGKDYWYILSATSCFSENIAPSNFLQNSFEIKKGDEFNFDELSKKLVNLDYYNEFQVSDVCEFSVRGGIIDIFSPLEKYPARLDFWGDEIEEIRLFSPKNQRTIKKVDSYTIISHKTTETANQNLSFLDYFNTEPTLITIFPQQSEEKLEEFLNPQSKEQFKEIISKKQRNKFFVFDVTETTESINNSELPFQPLPIEAFGNKKKINSYSREVIADLRTKQIKQWLNDNYQIYIAVSEGKTPELVKEYCKEHDLSFENFSIMEGDINEGVMIPSKKVIILTETEFLSLPPKKSVPPQTTEETKTEKAPELENNNFSDFCIGDYVVHLVHGIGRFKGLKEKNISGNLREVFEIEYDDEVILSVPIWQANLISRYIGSKKNLPKLSKIGTKKWDKLKSDAYSATMNLAVNMLEMQAVRKSSGGYAFEEHEKEQLLFDAEFPYTETKDQATAAEEIKNDMTSKTPMDRLICGDVGYGKTEVAMRAAFRAVAANKQVAVLVPTTVLSQQHLYTFLERFVHHPIIIETLSRFTTTAERNRILCDLKEGKVDIIIGTHKLLGNDIKFNDLGLLIIDEEQRFGVKHKEKLKKLRTTVDVLTMTATPIPRTLYMAMAGARELSTIMTAPINRLPIKTSVGTFNEKTIKEAIHRELERDGQIFFLHNRVKTIEQRCQWLRKIMPEVRFEVAHGQMTGNELEKTMNAFIEKDIDVLVCTTIIESGVDIPNTNTIIIERADRFGLAELYQLRGRVGRWNKQAYAHLLLPLDNILSGNAKERLNAIRRYTHLGAGLKLAVKDLEIRGAGNILGAKQSGHINAIGFELYCQLLKSAVMNLKGKTNKQFSPNVDISIDFVDFALKAAEGKITAGIPKEYIPSDVLRIEFYKKFTSAVSNKEFNEIEEEMRDRFGEIPQYVKNFILVMKIRLLVSQANCKSIKVTENYIFIEKTSKNYLLKNNKIPMLEIDDKSNKLLQLKRTVAELLKDRINE